MKNLLYFIFLAFFVTAVSCSQNEEPEPLDLNSLDVDSDSTQIEADEDMDGMLSGTFIDAAHPTSGTVVLDGNTIKIESDFRSDNGPDLYIYLAQGTDGNGFVDLGRLKNVAGEQEYTVPDGVDYTKNKYVLVWCKQFSVLFGSAELK